MSRTLSPRSLPLLTHQRNAHPTHIMFFSKIFVPIALAIAGASVVQGGPIAYGICQTGVFLQRTMFNKCGRWSWYDYPGCNVVTVACYAAAGATFGTVVAAVAAPPAILACNAALGTCSSVCATVALFAPTPWSGLYVARACLSHPLLTLDRYFHFEGVLCMGIEGRECKTIIKEENVKRDR